jgi:hypothetical protein
VSKFLPFALFAAVSAFAILGALVSYGTETGRTAMAAYGQAIVDQGVILAGAVAPDRLVVR